jgi:hypothetical protein
MSNENTFEGMEFEVETPKTNGFYYQVIELYTPSKESDEIIHVVTRFEGKNILRCKELAEQFYISQLSKVLKVSELNNLLLCKVDICYLPEDKNEWEKFNLEQINYPKDFGGSPEEWAKSEEFLLRLAGINITIPVWSERLKLLKKKCNFKE